MALFWIFRCAALLGPAQLGEDKLRTTSNVKDGYYRMIEIVTFTGVDTRTDFKELLAISRDYPHAEFGILVGSHTSEADHGIFPPWNVVTSFRELDVRTALHICGKWARTAAGVVETQSPIMMNRSPRPTMQAIIQETSCGFNRVQVNLHGDEIDPSRIDVLEAHIRDFADRIDASHVILQHRGQWTDIPTRHSKIEYLFDLSEGRGIESFSNWPAPPENGMRVGYAGGLGPNNIEQAIEFANKWPESPIWLDMEGRIRSNGYFDLSKVRGVCEQVWPQRGKRGNYFSLISAARMRALAKAGAPISSLPHSGHRLLSFQAF